MAQVEPTLNQKLVILKNLYRNGNKVPLMVRNGDLIYQMLTKDVFYVDTDFIHFDGSGGTYTINITATDRWTMTLPVWLTASQVSGYTSASVLISTTGATSEKLEGSIVITMGNKTHTIGVEQMDVRFVSCIYLDSPNFPMQSPSASLYTLDTGIYPAQDVEVRIGYIGTGKYNGGLVAGVVTSQDNNDFRYFTYSNQVYMDAGNDRITNGFSTTTSGVSYDISFGSLWVYNNLTNQYLAQGQTQTIRTDLPIAVDFASIKLKSLQIKNGGVVVFDGKAAVDVNGAGLYDTITSTMIRSTAGQLLTYDS